MNINNIKEINSIDNIIFKINDIEKLTILSNGNVGIGTTTPSYKLDVTGDINFTGFCGISGGLNINSGNLNIIEGNINNITSTELNYLSGTNKNINQNFVDTSNYIKNNEDIINNVANNINITNNNIIFNSNIIPSKDNIYDLGTPEFRFRDLYLGTNSLWLGDSTSLSASGGEMKIKKRNINNIPSIILSFEPINNIDAHLEGVKNANPNSGITSIPDVKIEHWLVYLKQLSGNNNLTANDLLGDNDYENVAAPNSWLENNNSNIILNSIYSNIGINNLNPKVVLDINATNAIRIPSGSILERPNTTGVDNIGYIRYNVEEKTFEGFGYRGNDIKWNHIGGVIDRDADTYITAENCGHEHDVYEDTDTISFYTDGIKRMSINDTGKIGIGKNAANNELEVEGNVDISGNLTVNNLTVNGTQTTINTEIQSTNILNIENNGTGTATTIKQTGANNILEVKHNTFDVLYINDSCNIGIANNNPDYRVDINGTLNIRNGSIKIECENISTNHIVEGSNLYYTNSRFNSDFDNKLSETTTTDIAEGNNLYYTEQRVNNNLANKTTDNIAEGNNLYYTPNRVLNELNNSNLYFKNNFVGINNTNPTESLHVNGNIKGNNFLGNGSNILNLNANNITSGKISNLILPNDINIDNNLVVVNKIGIGREPITEKLEVEGNAYINNNLTVGGNFNVIGSFITTNTDVTNTEVLNITNNGTDTAVSISQLGNNNIINIKKENSSVLFINEAGNIGINTILPSENLDVNGNIKAINIKGSGQEITNINANNITNGIINNSNLPQNITISDTLTAANLNISGTTAIINTLTFQTNNLNIINNTNNPSFKITHNSELYNIIEIDKVDLEILTITNSGKIGIGTTNPLTILNILKAQDPRIRITGTNTNDTAGLQLLEYNNDLQYGSELVYDGNNNYFQIKMYDNYVLNNALTIKRNDGNIGINNSIPNYKLDVNGDINITEGNKFKIGGINLNQTDIEGILTLEKGGTGATTIEQARTNLGVDPAGTDNSTNVTLANTNYLTISGQEITGNIIPISSGGTNATTIEQARTNLGVDPAGTDNSTNVTLANTNYLTISGQEITGNIIPISSGGTNATTVEQARSNLGANNADNISIGTINNARLPANISVTSLTGSGANITAINATNITSGTINNARLPSDISITGTLTTANLNVSGTSTTINTATYQTENLKIVSTYADGPSLKITHDTNLHNALEIDKLGTHLFSISHDGKVGIGTEIPSSILDVRPSIAGSFFKINLYAHILLNNGNSANAWNIANRDSGILSIGNGIPTNDLLDTSTDVLQILENGNIGIGKTPTTYKLDVNGDINIASGSKFKINGTNLNQTDIEGTLSVANGGTGATTALQARTNLGVDVAGTDNSTNVTLANTNYLSISGQEITGNTIPISSGGTGATTQAAARTALNVDVAGTDNSTDVTLTSVANNYLTISGQAITAGIIPISLGGTGATTQAAARTALNVDIAGTDNSTNVTLANTNYLTISGQEITGNTIPIASGGTGATSIEQARTNLGIINNVKADWVETNTSVESFIENKPFTSLDSNTLEVTNGVLTVIGGSGSTATTNIQEPTITSYGNVTDSLIAHYKFDGDFSDYSGNNFHLVPIDSVNETVEFLIGVIDGAASFNSSSDYLQVSSQYIDLTYKSYTISCWIKLLSNQDLYFFTQGGYNTDAGLIHILYWAEGQQIMFRNYGQTGFDISCPYSTISNWTHFAFVCEDLGNGNCNKYIYINGVLSGTQTNQLIFRFPDNSNYPFNVYQTGVATYMDDLRIYYNNLTATEVQTLYNSAFITKTTIDSEYKYIQFESGGIGTQLIWDFYPYNDSTSWINYADSISATYSLANLQDWNGTFGVFTGGTTVGWIEFSPIQEGFNTAEIYFGNTHTDVVKLVINGTVIHTLSGVSSYVWNGSVNTGDVIRIEEVYSVIDGNIKITLKKESSYSITFPENTECDILIVGGGGAGGNSMGGGGGAGGVVYTINQTIQAGTYTIGVGAGGIGIALTAEGPGSTGQGTVGSSQDGADSFIKDSSGNYVSMNMGGTNQDLRGIGGGGGGVYYDELYTNGRNGGSGGGSSEGNNSSTQYSGGTSTQPNTLWNGTSYVKGGSDGNGNDTTNNYQGGGGGGAGATNYNGFVENGKTGVQLNITGTNQYYAAGGGGGQYNNTDASKGLGGSGIGGDGRIYNGSSYTREATSGLNGTGSGGGGGAFNQDPDNPPGSGGSGIVIIRYKYASTLSVAKANWTETTTTAESYILNKPFTSLDTNTLDVTNGVLSVIGGGGGTTTYIQEPTITNYGDVNNALILHYKLDNDLSDSTGNYSDLIATNTNFNNGVINESIEFNDGDGNADGVGDWLQFPSNFNPYTIWNGNGITISFWLKLTETTLSFNRIFDFGKAGGEPAGYSTGLFLASHKDNWNGYYKTLVFGTNSPWGVYQSDTSKLDEIWTGEKYHHIVWCIGTDGLWTIYIDNVDKTSYVSGRPTTANSWGVQNVTYNSSYINRSTFYPYDDHFKGFVDDFRIYNKFLSETEVNTLYNTAFITTTQIDNEYKYIKFLNNGSDQTSYNITFPENTECDILIVGGGGAGGENAGGGGGAGGLVYGTGITLNGSYNIIVGKGGSSSGLTGYPSSINIDNITITGNGGGGGANSVATGAVGGSGGGGASYINDYSGGASNQTTLYNVDGITFTGYGNAGGLGRVEEQGGWTRAGGGGGGAGAPGNTSGDYPSDTGQSARIAYGGNGGVGREYNITGVSTYYAGGGGGAVHNDENTNPSLPDYPGTGGFGGGGNAGLPTVGGSNNNGVGSNGVNGLGGGGGAGGGGGGAGGLGGSGVVIIRYKYASIPTFNVSGNLNVTDTYNLNGIDVRNYTPFYENQIVQTIFAPYKKMAVKTAGETNWVFPDNNETSGFIVKITPKSSQSGILLDLKMHFGFHYNADARWWGARLYRKIGTGSWTWISDAGGDFSSNDGATGNGTSCWFGDTSGVNGDPTMGTCCASYMDLPNTTSEVIYTIAIRCRLGSPDIGDETWYINRAYEQGDSFRPAPMSSWTAQEIWKETKTIIDVSQW